MLQTLFGFKGRLSRPGFFEALLSIVLIDAALSLFAVYVRDFGLPYMVKPAAPLAGTVVAVAPTVLAVLSAWALLAVLVKRAHDRGRPGWLVLLLAVPVAGWLWLLADLFVLPGKPGRNVHGLSPLGGAPQDEWNGEELPALNAGAPAADAGSLDWTGQGADPHAKAAHGHGEAHADAHGHDDHGHDDHGHDDHGPAAEAHADDHGHVEAHGADHGDAGDHGHDDHGHAEAHHEEHGHVESHAEASGHAEAHGHSDAHGHGHGDDHGHAETHAEDHGHAEAHGHADDHGHGHAHAHHDDGHGHGHDDGHGHGDAHAHNHEHEHAHA